MISVESLDDRRSAQWDAFVDAHPHASIYHLTGWRTVIERSFAHKCHYLLASESDGTVVGVLPLTEIKSLLFGHYMVSLPFFTYGGPLSASLEAEQALLRAAEKLAVELQVSHLELRCQAPLVTQWPRAEQTTRTDKVTLVLELADTEAGLLKQLSSQRRSQIKKGKAAEPTILEGVEHIDDFYYAYARNMRDLGTPVYDRKFFKTIVEAYPQQTHVVSIRVGDQVAAGALVVGYRDKLEVPWVSTIRDFNSVFINITMYWALLQLAQRQGYRRFDFGRSSRDSGTYKFKRQWDAVPQQLYWHYWTANAASMPNLTPNNPKYAVAVKLWKHLPLAVANALGPHIVRNLP